MKSSSQWQRKYLHGKNRLIGDWFSSKWCHFQPLLRPLHTWFVFFVRIICTKNFFFKLLIGYEYFHTECEYHAAKKQSFYFLDQDQLFFFFPEHLHCEQTHQPITMVTRSDRHVRIPKQHKQQWLTSSSPVSLSTKWCLTNNMRIIKTTILDNIWQSIAK